MLNLGNFLVHWAITAFSLWLASRVFNGLKFSSPASLFVSALLLGFVNATLRWVLVVLTLPLSIVTFGLFLLVINALMLMLVARIVQGFRISGFWTAFFASIFISIVALVAGAIVGGGPVIHWDRGATWI